MNPTGVRELFGVTRSLVMYYGVPFRRQRLKQFYGRFVGPGDLCFDIGAHVGNRIRAFRDVGARVVALEPQPRFARFLERWYGTDPMVTILEQGVGAASGRVTLHTSSLTPTVTTFSKPWIDQVQSRDPRFGRVSWDGAVEARMTTLEDLIETYGEPRFCKIDVEGFEEQVLSGLGRPLFCLSFEFLQSARENAIACVERLTTLGDYEFNWSMVETMKLARTAWQSADVVKSALFRMPAHGRSGDVYARLKGGQAAV